MRKRHTRANGLMPVGGLSAFVTVLVLAAGVTAIGIVRGDGRGNDGQNASTHGLSAGAPGSGQVAAAERLVMGPFGIAVVDEPELTPEAMPWLRAILELGADGSFVEHSPNLPSDFTPRRVLPTTDGGLLMVGSHDLDPGRPRPDGAYVEGVAFPLLTFDADGALLVERDLRIVGEDITLLGATETEAILLRGTPQKGVEADESRIVAHDLVTGDERELARDGRWAMLGDVGGDRVLTGGGLGCSLASIELSTGAVTDLAVPECDMLTGVALSTDGSVAAAVYRAMSNGPAAELRVAMFDSATGTRSSDDPLGNTMPYGDREGLCRDGCPQGSFVDYAGMAWNDDATLRVALIEQPADGDPRAVSVPEAIRIAERHLGTQETTGDATKP